MNYTAPLPDSYNSTIINALEQTYDYAAKKIDSVIKSVKAVASSAELNIGIPSAACLSDATSVIYFAHVEIPRQSTSSFVLPDFVKTLQKTATVGLEYLTQGFETFFNIFSALEIFLLYPKTMENIHERAEANASGDENKILRANFNAVALTTDWLKAPAAIVAFLILCGVAIPAIAVTAISVIAAAGVFFLAAKVFVAYTNRIDTSNLLNELKLTRHRVFLDEYYTALIERTDDDEEKVDLGKLRDGVHGLSLAETTAAKKEIKRSIETLEDSDGKKAIYKNSLKSANQHFIKLLNEMIAQNPKIVGAHFRVELPKADDEEVELSTCSGGEWKAPKGNFFEKLSLPQIQSDDQKLQKAVHCLKMRLEDKLLSDESEMILGSFGLVAAGLGVVSTAGIAIAPLIATVAVLLGVPKIALLVEEHYFRKPEFIAAMERITAAPSDLDPEVEDDEDLGDDLSVSFSNSQIDCLNESSEDDSLI